MTSILSETLAPPMMATKGLMGSATALPRYVELLFHQQAGGGLGTKWVMPSVEAWARWALPKASLM